MRSILLAVLTALALSWFVPTVVEASCTDSRLFGSFVEYTTYSYIYTPGIGDSENPPTVSETFDASFWMLGYGDPVVGSGLDNGDFPSTEWMFTGSAYPAYVGLGGTSSWDSDPRIDGCSDSADAPRCMVVGFSDEGSDGAGYFGVIAAEETVSQTFLFGIPFDAPATLAPIPRPAL